MENKIEYVLYENVKNNEYINKIKPIDEAVKKIKRTENGVAMEIFYNFTPYKNIRTLSELSKVLKDDEYLIIDLTQVKKSDEKKAQEDKLYESIKETIDEKTIIPYVYHDLENDLTPKREVGEKLHLIKYNEISKNPTDFKDYILVQIKMNEDQTCEWESISFSSRHKRELDEDLSYRFGGFSGLYYLIPEAVANELESYYEITKIEDGKWDFIKKNKERSK